MRPLLALFLTANAFAAKVTIGPYVQDVRPDGFVVAFETDVETHAAVEVGANRTSTHGRRHEARIAGLQPGVRYKYRLIVDDVESGGGEVLTAPPVDSDRPFTFLVYGDTREGGEDEKKIALAMLAEGADFALHTGDICRTGADEPSWMNFFKNEAPLIASLPVYPAVGNHEIYKDETGEHFKRFFVLPDEGRTRHYYRMRWGRAVELVALDGNGSFDEQTRWLREGLRKAEMDGVKHVFIYLHQPPFSTGGHCGAAVQEQDWVELFEKHHIVRAVFGGHDHCYERLERNGVRYFVAGGGGTRVYPEATACPSFDYAARKIYAAQHHYIRVKVKGDEIDITAIPLEGAPIDSVHFTSKDLLAGSEAPPLVDDRIFGGVPRNYVLYGAGFGLLLILGGFLRKRRA
jgi:hypothetical protein